MAAPRVLMLGTAPCGRGGIAAVVSVLRRDGLFEREGVRYLATHADGSRVQKTVLAVGGLCRTARTCLRDRPAVVHAHSASHASFYRKSLLLLLARRCGARTVLHVHGGGFRQFALHESGPLARRWIRHTLEASSVVIALSAGWAGVLSQFAPAARVRVLPNPVDLSALSSSLPEERERILFLGRADSAKGLDDLLAAAAVLAPEFPRLRLAVGGDGEPGALRTRAARLGIADRVELLGWLGAGEKASQLARAAVFCLPSRAEGLPMAMLEAMAAGKAVVVTPVGAIPEVVVDGDNGLLVPPADVSSLSAALARVLRDEPLRRALGARARATVAARFSAATVGAGLARVYAELCGKAA